jgi:hypothetical protein
MGNRERDAMQARLEQMTPEQQRDLLLELANATRPGDDLGAVRIQDADVIWKMRPKVEVWTYLPRTGRTDKRQQDRKVWDTPGVLDPYATEDMPDRPQIVKVIDLTDGTVLFERDEVLAQPRPGGHVRVGRDQLGGESDTDLAARMVALLRSNPTLRKAVVDMTNDDDDDARPTPPPKRRGRPPANDPASELVGG